MSLRPSIFVVLLFVATVFYNGPGYNLQALAVCWVVLACWLTLTIADQGSKQLAAIGGRLPTLMAAYIVWLVLAPSISSYFYVSSIQAAELLLLPLVFFAWLLDVREDQAKIWGRTWNLLLTTGLALAVWGTIDFLYFHERAHGPFIDANAYGALINLILVPLVWKYFSRIASDWKGLRIQLLAITILALAQFMTLSRGALVAFVLILFLLLWINRERHAFISRLALLLLLLGTSYLFVKLGPVNVGQLAGAGIEKLALNPGDYVERDNSLQARLLLWKSTCAMIADSNVFVGRGLGTFKTFYPQYRIEGEHSLGNYAHNDYLQALLEGGLVQFAFLVMLTGVIPIWLLVKNQAHRDREEEIPGLLLGVLCVSIHAVVNFIHFVIPIVLFCGLYLAVSWQSVKEKHGSDTLNPLPSTRGNVIKLACIVLLVLQTSIVVLDGLIFKIFGSAEPIVTDEQHRRVLLNAALALRPRNPTPHTTVILNLLDAANSGSPETRSKLLKSAEMEATILAQVAPSYPLVPLLLGKIWALRGSHADLITARDHLEVAVKRTPHSTAMRTELIEVYRKLDRNQDAYRVVTEAKPWLLNETSLKSFGIFVKHAEELAITQKKPEEAKYWRWVKAQIAEAMSKDLYSSRMHSPGR